MIVGDSPADAPFPERAGVDMLDGLRLEYIASVLRFFTGVSEVRVAGDFSSEYDEVTVLVDGCVSRDNVKDAVEHVTGREVSGEEGCEGFCCSFTMGRGDTATEFRVVCSEDSLGKDAELYSI